MLLAYFLFVANQRLVQLTPKFTSIIDITTFSCRRTNGGIWFKSLATSLLRCLRAQQSEFSPTFKKKVFVER